MTLDQYPEPALWIGRRVKLPGRDGAKHLVRAKLQSIDPKGRVTALPHGHRASVTVQSSEVTLWWSDNPDIPRP